MDARAQAGARLDWTGSDGSDGLDQMDAFHVGRALASSLLQVLRGRGVAAQRFRPLPRYMMCTCTYY